MSVEPQSLSSPQKKAQRERKDMDDRECESLELLDDVVDGNDWHRECGNASIDCIGIGEEKNEKDFVPKVGMEFLSEDAAYDFYNEYARRTGFGIRKSFSAKANGVLTHRIICCYKAGIKGSDKRNKNVKKPQPESRTECKADIRIRLCASGKYVIRMVTLEHNHDMVPPEMVHLLRSHRNLTVAQASKADIADCSGDNPSLEVGKRYKELCYIFRQIATKASEYTESYDIAIKDAKRMLLNVDEAVKHATPIESLNVATSTHCDSEQIDINDLRPTSVLCGVVPHVTPDEPDNVATSTRCQNEEEDVASRVKGIKQKMRGGHPCSSVHCKKNALAIVVSKKRKSKTDCEQLEDNVDKPAKKKSKPKEIGATQVSTPSSQILTNQVASTQFSIPSQSTQEASNRDQEERRD